RRREVLRVEAQDRQNHEPIGLERAIAARLNRGRAGSFVELGRPERVAARPLASEPIDELEPRLQELAVRRVTDAVQCLESRTPFLAQLRELRTPDLQVREAAGDAVACVHVVTAL